MTKKQIIEDNKKLGIKTAFFGLPNDILGYYENGTIFLNEFYPNDLEKINKHEILHMFEESKKFKMAKDIILNSLSSKEKGQLYRQYFVRYAGLYSEQEIENGILDKEVVIDAIIGNGKFSKKVEEIAKGLFDFIVGDKQSERNYKKRYLNLALSNKIEQNFAQLTNWEKLFVLNYYQEEKRGLPNNKQTKYQEVRNDINNELERLYSFADNGTNFEIIVKDNEELERELRGRIEVLKARGEENEANYILDNKTTELSKMAKTISKTLQAEYKHIVDFIKTSEYEPAFKCLMLRETLNKTYKQEKVDGESKTIVKKRELHKSISGHMTLNENILRVIYNNLKDYSSFANLYFAGIEIFNKKLTEKSEISLSNVDTFNMGKWIKFEGKTSNEKMYIKNAQDLASLVQDTPWCTKNLASTHLAQGDFYVFVDNDNKPHIAVKMNGNEIDEVRGIKNANAQELEDDYRKVVIEFLKKNKDIKYGKEWLEKEEWNKRLVGYITQIENNDFNEVNFDQFCHDIFKFEDYKAHNSKNYNKGKILNYVETNKQIQEIFAKNYNCNVEDICYKLYIPENYDVKIKICLRDAKFDYSKNFDLSSLTNICGYASFSNSQVTDLSSLISIGEFANFIDSKVTDLSSLTSIGGDAEFIDSQVKDLSSLISIGGHAKFKNSKVTNLSSLKTIGRNADFCMCEVINLNSLQNIGGSADFFESKVTNLSSLLNIGGDADFRNSIILDLSSLQSIGENADFRNSQVTNLNSLQRIGGDANFRYSKVTDLSSLQSIDENADFRYSKVTDLNSLQSIGGYAVFMDCQVSNLSNLQIIKGYANFKDSQVTDLSSLQSIGGYAYFKDSKVTDLSSLQSIGEGADFYNCEISNLKSLQFIGGWADFRNSEIKDLSALQTINGWADFRGSKVNKLPSLKEVNGNVYLDDWQAELFGDMFVKEGDHYRFVPENERIKNRKADNEKDSEESEK